MTVIHCAGIPQERQIPLEDIRDLEKALEMSRDTFRLLKWIEEVDFLLNSKNRKRGKGNWSEIFDKGITPREAVKLDVPSERTKEMISEPK